MTQLNILRIGKKSCWLKLSIWTNSMLQPRISLLFKLEYFKEILKERKEKEKMEKARWKGKIKSLIQMIKYSLCMK